MNSLRSKGEFQEVFNGGGKYVKRHFILYALPNELNALRLGLVVGRKIGNAVERNRVKRILRESFRSSVSAFLTTKGRSESLSYDIVLVPRHRCVGAKSTELIPSLIETLKTLDEKSSSLPDKSI